MSQTFIQQVSHLTHNQLKVQETHANGIKFSKWEWEREVARGFLYVLYNDLHTEPFGFMEDIFVEEDCRGKGYGNEIVKAIIDGAKAVWCYKLLGTSRYARPKVHEWYKKLGFIERGVEFRMDF